MTMERSGSICGVSRFWPGMPPWNQGGSESHGLSADRIAMQVRFVGDHVCKVTSSL
jgi:hypothetical protein